MKLSPVSLLTIMFPAAVLLSCGRQHPVTKNDNTAIVSTATSVDTLPPATANPVTENTPVPVDSITSTDGQLKIYTFSEFPPQIDGCACYYSANETSFKAKQFIYADDYMKTAFMLINGKMTKMELSASDTLQKNSVYNTFSNAEYEVTIQVQQIGESDETWQQTGIITLKRKNGKEMVIPIYGECGC